MRKCYRKTPGSPKFNVLHWIVAAGALLILVSCTRYNNRLTQRKLSFNEGWRFHKGEAPGAEMPSFNDSEWRVLDVPHDWSIEDLPEQPGSERIGPFTPESPGQSSTGYTIGGTGWYRKTFTLDKFSKKKKVLVYFDGVYMISEVYINGHFLGNRPNGYVPFYFDLTPHLQKSGKENVLAVKVRNEGRNSRWYSGSGIYRNVDLWVMHPVHIPVWGQFITTTLEDNGKASVTIATTVNNETDSKKEIEMVTTIYSPEGIPAGKKVTSLRIQAGERVETLQVVGVADPRLWSPDDPVLYQSFTEIAINGKTIDQLSSTFGIRTIEFSADKGFLLNGQPLLLKGGCLHHDNGPLGAAAIDRAEERRVELMKHFGFNAVRTAHNPPSANFLNACDRLGMLVIDELFDQWQLPKNPDDYHVWFDEWHQRDLEATILRDRNHPSIILWSIGNEIKERADSSGQAIARRLSGLVKALDTTRLVNAGICSFWEFPGRSWEESAPAFESLDVAGYNYLWKQYEEDHARYPERIIIGTESVAADALENWRLVEKYPWVLGDFVWTAMDYYGEAGIGHAIFMEEPRKRATPGWPWYNAFCGDIDICGFKKPQSHFRDVVWKASDLEMAVRVPAPVGQTEWVSFWGWPNELQSWNWPQHEGQTLTVVVYSNYPEVRLELNGSVIGNRRVSDETRLTARFEVPYEPGELKVYGLKDGIPVDHKSLLTTGHPSKIRLSADRSKIRKDRNDLSFITVEIMDDAGRPIPDAAIPVHFMVNGPGELAAVENGKPNDVKRFRAPFVTTFNGKALAIIRPLGKTGAVTLEATSSGISGDQIRIELE